MANKINKLITMFNKSKTINKLISNDIITKENTPITFEMFHNIIIRDENTHQDSQMTFDDLLNISNYEKEITSVSDIRAVLLSTKPSFSFYGFGATEDEYEISLYNDRITIYKPIDDFIQKRNVRINWYALGSQEIKDAEFFFKVGLEAVYISNALQEQWNKQNKSV
jgi:hypothetical protein